MVGYRLIVADRRAQHAYNTRPRSLYEPFKSPAAPLLVPLQTRTVPYPNSCFVLWYQLRLPDALPSRKSQTQLLLTTQNPLSRVSGPLAFKSDSASNTGS